MNYCKFAVFYILTILTFPFCTQSCIKEHNPPVNVDDDPPVAQPDSGLNYTLTITFDGEAKDIKASIPLLKYNKKKCVAINFDDGNLSALETLDKFQSLTYTDGCNNRIPYSADVAVNGRHGWDNRELGASPGGPVQYSDMKSLIEKNWDIANHGFYHNAGEEPYTNGNNARKNLLDLDSLILKKTGYKMNCLVVPTNYPGYMIAGEGIGYLGGTSSNTFDNIVEPQMWDGWRHPKRLSKYTGEKFTVIQREFAENQWRDEDYTWSGLRSTINETEPCMQNFGTHGLNPNENTQFRKWMDLIASSMSDEVMMTSMREFLEYQHLRYNVVKKESADNKQLKVEIDYSKVPNKHISWKDLSFILSGNSNIVSVVCSNNAYKITYNATTRLINVTRRQTKW